MKKKGLIALVVFSGLLFLGACSQTTTKSTDSSEKNTMKESSSSEMGSMEGMNHEGQTPSAMVVAVNPKYPVGTSVIITEGHMDGMMDAKATVTAAYDTTIYEITFDPTNGGATVKNHKWVVQEELKDKKNVAKIGDSVILEANHTVGMMGAEATVDEAITGTVYVVDYEANDGSGMVKNHMWVTESELKTN